MSDVISKVSEKPLSKTKRRSYIEYKIGILSLIVIGICIKIGIEKNHDNNIFNIILIASGLILLLCAGNIVLEYAVKLAETIGISELVIGLTIVSIGTSIPEIFTSIVTALNDAGGLLVGDIYGSYFTQLTIFLGIVMIMIPTSIRKENHPHITRDGILMVIALGIMTLTILDGVIYLYEAIISTLLFFSYLFYLYRKSIKDIEEFRERNKITAEMEEVLAIHIEEIPHIYGEKSNKISHEKEINYIKSPKKLLLFYIFGILFGSFFTYIGADHMVMGSVNIAEQFQISDHVIGLTIIAFGTGLPEFIVAYLAVKKGKPDIAYGNLLGSNIVDPLFSISIGVFVREITLSQIAVQEILLFTFPAAIAVGIFLIIIFNRKSTSKALGQFFGILLIIVYIVYILFIML